MDAIEENKHAVLVADFELKVKEVQILEHNLDRLLVDYTDVFLQCGEQHFKHFALQLIAQVTFMIDRVKLLKTGQCVRIYQKHTEYQYLSPDYFCSFELFVREQGKFASDLQLSACSYEGIKFFGSDRRSSAHKLMLDNARSVLDALIVKYLTQLESTLTVLYSRPDIIIKGSFEVSIKIRQYVKIVGKSKQFILDSSNTTMFESMRCQADEINNLYIQPLDGCVHSEWLTSRVVDESIRELEVQEFTARKNKRFVEQTEQAALNKLLNVGSRSSAKRKKVSTTSSAFSPHSPLDGFQTTCETADSANSGRSSSSCFRASGAESNDRLLNNGSTPMAVVSSTNLENKGRVSEVLDLDLSVYDEDDETDFEKEARIRKQNKRARQEKELEVQRRTFGDDFIVGDDEGEEVESDSSVFPLLRSPAQRSGRSGFLKRSVSDEEYCEEDDEILKQYRVVKSVDKGKSELAAFSSVKEAMKSGTKMVISSSNSNKTSAKKGSGDNIKAEVFNPYDVPEVRYRHVGHRKSSKPTDYVEEIEVHVHNKLYSKVLVTQPDGTSRSMIIRTPEELKAVNQELDVSFISFLVSHTVTIVGSEIALERCIIDYVLKKQKLNELNPLEQQDISNWKEIFIAVEHLIMAHVRAENDGKKDTLDKALLATVELAENEFRQARNLLQVSDATLSGQEQADNIHKLRGVMLGKNDYAKRLTMDLKLLLDTTLKTTNHKINNAIHYIAMKVCVYWANINNCLDIVDPGLVEKYSNKFLRQERLAEQLRSASSTGRLLIEAEKCPDQVAVPEDTNKALEIEETELKSIMRNDHAEDLMKVIYSVKAEAVDIVSLVDILWSKTPRTKLSTAVKVKKEGAEAKDKNKKESTDVTIAVGASAAADVGVVPTDLSICNIAGVTLSTPTPTSSLLVGAGLQEGGLTQCKLSTDSNGKLTFSLNSQQSSNSSSANVSDRADSGSIYRHLDSVAMSYDVVIKALLTGLVVQNGALCLEIDFKDKKLFLENRLQLLLFLLTHHQCHDIDAVLREFNETEGIYDLLNCLLYVKVDDLDGSVILGDGYCFYRSIYQLYLRQAGDFELVANDMKTCDRKCNVKKEASSTEHLSFADFVERLPSHVKEDEGHKAPFNVDNELARFKFNSDCDMLSVLLKVRPGVPLPNSKMWGSQSAVSFLNFNVTSLEVLSDKPSTVVEKLLAADRSGKTGSRWTRYQASSLPVPRSTVSRARSALAFQDLDLVANAPFNPIFYTPGHFTVGATIHAEQQGTITSLADSLCELKQKFFVQAFQRVRILEEMFPDVMKDLTDLFSSLRVTLTNHSIIPNIITLDSTSFVNRLHAQFPESIRLKSDLVDLSGEDETDDTPHVAELKELVKLNKTKVELLAMYNCVLRDLLMKAE